MRAATNGAGGGPATRRPPEQPPSDELAGIMAVSRAVAEGKALDDTLTEIAHTAATLAGRRRRRRHPRD